MAYQEYINQINNLADTLAKKPQTVGFVHKFFVPGWIGFIQECIVENKMSKVAKQPIYNGMGYLECGNKIAELVDKACRARIESDPNFAKSNDDSANLQILSASLNALDAWAHVYPEIAYWMNQKINDQYVTNALGIIQGNVKNSISTIMDVPSEKISNKSSSFASEMKAMGGQIAAMFCNVIVFAAVFSLLAAIFG